MANPFLGEIREERLEEAWEAVLVELTEEKCN